MKGRSRSGLTVVETAIAAAISAGLILGVGMTLRTTTRLSEWSRMDMIASEENRFALERLSGALRGAAADTLGGFDAGGVATALEFRTATAFASGVLTHSGVVRLEWRATAPVAGVADAGEVVRVQDGVSTLVAKRVRSGGFSVTRRSGGLLIHVETFAPIPHGETSHVAGDTFVRLRN